MELKSDVSAPVDVQGHTYSVLRRLRGRPAGSLPTSYVLSVKLAPPAGILCPAISQLFAPSGRPSPPSPSADDSLPAGKAHVSPAGSLRLRLKQYRTIQRGVCHLSVR